MRFRQARPTPRSVHTEWSWPPSPTVSRTLPAGYRSYEQVILPEVDPGPQSTYTWSHRFTLIEGASGYVGLDIDGTGKHAVFGLADQRAGVPYGWVAGGRYAVRIAAEERTRWVSSVRDLATGIEMVIARMEVPPEWRWLGSPSWSSTEYSGDPLVSCDQLTYASAVFWAPIADDGSVPGLSQSRIGPGSCDGSRFDSFPDGVRHEIGRLRRGR